MEFKFTVFTPCYNSERFIHRVYESLETQTYRDFEWLVLDDASSDATLQLLKQYQKQSDFNIRILENESNQMLAKNFNIGFAEAKGEFFLALGHDDAMKPDALERLAAIWEEHQADNISGIWSLCEDQHGSLVGHRFPKDLFVSNYFEIVVDHIWTLERFPCVKTKLLNDIKFDTSELDYIPEDVLWGMIAINYDTIFTNDILRIYYIEPENKDSLTKRNRSQMSAYVVYQYAIWINSFLSRIPNAFAFKLRMYMAFSYYAIIDKSPFFRHLKKIEKSFDKFLILLLSPLSFSISLLHRIKGN